jgi:ligand-binding sensor domain-containing protein
MGERKSCSINICGLAAAIFFLFASPGQGTIRQWQSFTSFNQVQDMALCGGDVWVATTGGLVRINPDSMTHQTYTNVDGLETNQIFSLCVDNRNRLWVGGRGRLVDFTDPQNPDGYLLTDRDGGYIDIYDIVSVPGGDSLWLANRLGVSLFLPSETPGDGLIIDTYTRLGGIERDTPARRLALDADNVWVGTDRGLAIGNLADVRQLKTPSNWLSYFPTQMDGSLPFDSIKGLVIKDDTIYLGTWAGMYRFDTDPDTNLVDLGMYNAPIIYNLSLTGDSVFVHSARGSQIYYDGTFFGLPWDSMPIPNTTAAVIDNNGVIWNGNLAYGIYYLQGEHLAHYDAGGAPSNDCRRVVAAQGKIWGAFWRQGLACYENGRWHSVDSVIGLVNTLGVGPLGELWVGTWGAGVYRIMGDSMAHFDNTNSALSGPYEAPSFVVVSDIHSTGNAVWFGNLRGNEGELVAVNPYDTDQWQNYTFVGGASAEWVTSVAVGQGVVYTGTLNNGIYVVECSGTPFYTGDDFRWKFTSSNAGIGSDMIGGLSVDGYDTLWVGTSFGLSYQALGEVFFNNVNVPDSFGPGVTALAFDGQGSLYTGSARGMAIRDIGMGTFEHLIGKNSGLVDDNISDIYYRREQDAFWISTSGGISRLSMPYALATQELDETLAYPNPYVIRYGYETVRFNFSGLSEVRIFTLSGELVREIPVTGVWDGKNADNKPVASGVYIFTLTDLDGNTGRGKILLIRE